jgi:pantoate kinase
MIGTAFCPAHVTGFFKAEIDNLEKSESIGSLGAGFSIQDGVITTVNATPQTKSDFKIKVSGYQSDNTQVSEYVVKQFLEYVNDKNYFIDVHHEISVPVGFGLGCSGAVALSLAYALNQSLDTKLTDLQIGQIAHKAEVSCKTGLGDVLASYHGGFEIRTKSGAPGVGSLEKIKTDSSNVIIICFAPISTKKFLDEKLSMINGLGGKMVNKLVVSKNSNEFQDMSIEFAKYIQIVTPKMDAVIKDLHDNGIKCGVALFGETIFALIPDHLEDKVMNILKKYDDGIIIKSKIDDVGARLTNQ